MQAKVTVAVLEGLGLMMAEMLTVVKALLVDRLVAVLALISTVDIPCFCLWCLTRSVFRCSEATTLFLGLLETPSHEDSPNCCAHCCGFCFSVQPS